ncbi:MAG: hypothetical protein ACYS3N_09430 [Planctomycetota bacterium]|jgi:hypothetical protein
MVLKTARITKQINSLHIGDAEKQILALAVSFGEKGLTASTATLADFLCINIRNTNKAIQKLKKRKLVKDKENERQKRKLVVNQAVFDALVVSCKTGAKTKQGSVSQDHKSCPTRPEVVSHGTDKYKEVNKEKEKTKRNNSLLPLGDDNVTENTNPEPQSQPNTQELPELLTVYQEKYPEDPHRFVSTEQQAFNERCNAAIRTETENVS